jgi:hypothetical protein
MTSHYEYIKAMGFPSQTAEAKRKRYQQNAAAISEHRRLRYATDPEYREQRQAANRASYRRRKG